MFLWRWFKRLVFLGILALVAYAVSGSVMWHGRSVREQVQTVVQSTQWKEGMKDLRSWLGALLQLAGKKMEEGITPEDQQRLDLIFKQDVQKEQLQKQLQGLGIDPDKKSEATQ